LSGALGTICLFAAYLGRYVENNQGLVRTNGGSTAATAGHDTYDATIRIQGGYLIDQHWEPFVRYEYLSLDSAGLPAGSDSTVHEITAGVNYYFRGQRAKFSADVSYLPNGSPVNDDGSGVLIGPGKNQIVLRAQFSDAAAPCAARAAGRKKGQRAEGRRVLTPAASFRPDGGSPAGPPRPLAPPSPAASPVRH